jgi:hypothetical protein
VKSHSSGSVRIVNPPIARARVRATNGKKVVKFSGRSSFWVMTMLSAAIPITIIAKIEARTGEGCE